MWSTLATDPEQQGLNVEEELQEDETSIPAISKKNMRKVTRKVVIKEVSMRMSSDNLLIPRSSQSCVARKRRMTNMKYHLVIY